MRRRFIPWFPLPVIWGFGFAFFTLEFVYFYLERNFGFVQPSVRPSYFILNVFVAFYSFVRVATTHPFYNSDYRRWLETTPWATNKFLPMGPIEFVWQDACVLGVVMLLGLLFPPPCSVRFLNLALITMTIACLPALWILSLDLLLFATAIPLLLALGLWRYPWLSFGLHGVAYLIAYEGTWQALNRLPWDEKTLPRLAYVESKAKDVERSLLGWPHKVLMEDARSQLTPIFTKRNQMLLSLIAGWILFCLFLAAPSIQQDPQIAKFCMIVACIPAFVIRIAVYFNNYRAPTGLMGRLGSNQLIIPKYDRYLLESILPIGVVASFIWMCEAGEMNHLVTLPLGLTFYWLMTLPTWDSWLAWIMTGSHRISHSLNQKTTKDYVKIG